MGAGIVTDVPTRKVDIKATPEDAGTGTDDCTGVVVIQTIDQFLGRFVAELLELDVLDQWSHDLIDAVVFGFVRSCFAVLVVKLQPIVETLQKGDVEAICQVRMIVNVEQGVDSIFHDFNRGSGNILLFG